MHVSDSIARGGLWPPLAIILASLIALAAAYALLPEHALQNLVSESGALEIGTALLYIVLVGVLLVQARPSGLGLVPALLAALMLARELDLHRQFATKGITSVGFYTDPTIPLALRLVIAAFLAGIGITVVAFLIRIAPQAIAALRRRKPFIYPVAAAGFLIAVALVLDGIGHKLHTVFSITLTPTSILYLAVLEEAAELLIPAMLLLAAWQGRPLRTSSELSRPGPHSQP